MSDFPIAISTGPHTRPCTEAARRLLAERGRPVLLYEADGKGGRDLEAEVLAGRIAAVLDLTLTELAAEMLGRPGGAGLDRLTAAALRGISQVIALGGLDAVPASGGRQPPEFLDSETRGPDAPRSPGRYHRTTPEEFDSLGREIAIKASAARGPTTVLIPRIGVSMVLIQSFRNWISPKVHLRELELHINDPAFAFAAVEALENELKP